MNKLVMAAASFAAAGLGLFAQPSEAHGIWFAQRAGRLALVYGEGAEDLDAVKRLPKITSVAGWSAEAQDVAVSLQPQGPLAVVDAQALPAVITATMDNGLWTKDTQGKWHGKGKDEVPGAAQSGRYMKYTTHLASLPAGAMRPQPGLALQLVPVGKSFPRHRNEKLTVQVLFEGRPLPRAKVWPDMVGDPDARPLVADAHGRITLPVRNQGHNVVKTEHESAAADPGKADMTHHLATLSFALGHAPE
jgi:nickel transport protein